MAALQRRYFLKQASVLALSAFFNPHPRTIFSPTTASTSSTASILSNSPTSPESLEQKIIINLPSYELTLLSLEKGSLAEKHVFTVGIGRNAYGRDPTPVGEGLVSEKRDRVVFRYGQDYPQYNKKRGDVISWTNTYDENGKPVGYKMPYKEMRSLTMKIKSTANGYLYWNDKYVIHSTTDEFTLGTPSSEGCIRLGMKDMLKLYDLVVPDAKKGELKNPVKLNITYKVLELKNESLIIHADVYKKNIDYAEEFKAGILNTGPDILGFNHERVKKEFADANAEFEAAHKEILSRLLKDWPDNYLSPELRQKLHRTYKLSEFAK
jgi:hypothetical protein